MCGVAGLERSIEVVFEKGAAVKKDKRHQQLFHASGAGCHELEQTSQRSG